MAKRKDVKQPPKPKPTASEQLDRQLAATAIEKKQRGETPGRDEQAALRRVEQQREEDQRWAYYATIPKKHWVEMSGRQPKVVNEQAARYGVPIGGRTIDLPAFVRAFHDFLAKHALKLAQEVNDATPSDRVTRSEADRRKAAEEAAIRRLRRLELEGTLVPREDLVRGELALVAHVVNRLDEMVEALPGDIAPDDPGPVRLLLRDWVDRFREDTAEMKFFAVPSSTNGRAANPAKRKAALKRHKGNKR